MKARLAQGNLLSGANTPRLTNLSSSFLKTSLCTLGTAYGLAYGVSLPGLTSKETGEAMKSPNVPSKSSSYSNKELTTYVGPRGSSENTPHILFFPD